MQYGIPFLGYAAHTDFLTRSSILLMRLAINRVPLIYFTPGK